MERRQFEMSQADLDGIMDKLQNARRTPLLATNCGMPPSIQEVANAAWAELGSRLGFDPTTVHPGGRGDRFFTAIPTLPPETPNASEPFETGWLIESWDSKTGQFKASWWALGLDNEDGCGWTTESTKALRFARACDAQAYIDDIGWTEAKPTEHLWPEALEATFSAATVERLKATVREATTRGVKVFRDRP